MGGMESFGITDGSFFLNVLCMLVEAEFNVQCEFQIFGAVHNFNSIIIDEDGVVELSSPILLFSSPDIKIRVVSSGTNACFFQNALF